jgi:hypothetical protein
MGGTFQQGVFFTAKKDPVGCVLKAGGLGCSIILLEIPQTQ